MAKRVGVDKWIFFTTLLLVLVGLAMVFSASAVVSQAQYNSPYMDVARQAGWALAGVVAMIVLMQIDASHYNSPRFIFPALSISTLLLVAVFFFHTSHNTHRWIVFGGHFTFQPSEIAASSSFSSSHGSSPRELSTRCATGRTLCCAPPSCR